MKFKRILIVFVAGTLTAVGGGAAAWWGLKAEAARTPEAVAAAADKKERAEIEKNPPKYVNLEKVIVMLRREPGESSSHYLAVDLVFKTPEEKEKVTKEHLPMLRSVAVRALSTLTPAKAGTMTIDQFSEAIGRAYADSYAAEKRDKPFSDVMIGKLIIE